MDSDSYIDEDDDFAGFGEALAEKPSFDRADLKYAQSRTSSQYKIEVLSFIKTLPITDRLKKEYYSCVYSLFAPEQVLANNNPRAESRFIKSDPLKRILIFAEQHIKLVAACSATKGDKLKINVGALEKYIHVVYEAYITRTLGSDREGIRNSVLTSESVSRAERSRESQWVTKPKKTGILNFGGD